MNLKGANLEVVLSILAYSACSGSLVLVNKLILFSWPYPSLVVCIQLVATLAFIFAAKFTNFLPVDPVKWEYVVPYLLYIVFFVLGVYCNMMSLTLSNVETVIVFRSLTPVVVAFLDVMFLGREYPSLRSWAGLALIGLGAYGYASYDEQFQTQGYEAYFWPTAYLILIALEMAYGKKIIRSVPLKTLSGPVLYTNLLGFLPMLLFAFKRKDGMSEFARFHQEVFVDKTHPITAAVIFWNLLGCVAGTAIGYSAWWCRDKVSATSFTLIGVLNKCLTIMLNFVMWDQHAPAAGVACLFVCLIGGSIYQQAPMRPECSEPPKPGADDKSLPMTATNGGGSSNGSAASSRHRTEDTKALTDHVDHYDEDSTHEGSERGSGGVTKRAV